MDVLPVHDLRVDPQWRSDIGAIEISQRRLGNEGLFPQHFQEQVLNHVFRRSMIQTVGTRIGHQRRAVLDVQRFHFVPCEPCCLQRLLLEPFKLQTYDTRSAPFCLRPFRIRSSSSAKYWPLRCSAARLAADLAVALSGRLHAGTL